MLQLLYNDLIRFGKPESIYSGAFNKYLSPKTDLNSIAVNPFPTTRKGSVSSEFYLPGNESLMWKQFSIKGSILIVHLINTNLKQGEKMYCFSRMKTAISEILANGTQHFISELSLVFLNFQHQTILLGIFSVVLLEHILYSLRYYDKPLLEIRCQIEDIYRVCIRKKELCVYLCETK